MGADPRAVVLLLVGQHELSDNYDARPVIEEARPCVLHPPFIGASLTN